MIVTRLSQGAFRLVFGLGGVKVEQVENLTGNSWVYEGEASSDGGVLRAELEIRVSTYNSGVSSNPNIVWEIASDLTKRLHPT